MDAHASQAIPIVRRYETDAWERYPQRPLTDMKLRSLKAGEKSYKVWDSGGLFVAVLPSGTRSWQWMYRFAVSEDRLERGPTQGLRRALMPLPKTKHMAKVPVRVMPRLLEAIWADDGEVLALFSADRKFEAKCTKATVKRFNANNSVGP